MGAFTGPIQEVTQVINPPAVFSAGVSYAPGATTVTCFRFDGSGNALETKGDSVPGAEAGYGKGCVHIKTNAVDGAQCQYKNLGNATVAQFVLDETITPGEIALTNGKILQGNVSNVAVEKTLGATASTPTFTGAALGTHSHLLQESTGEVLTVTPGTGVSSAAVGAPIAVVESVYVTAGGVTGVFALVPGGVTPTASEEVGYNPTTGVFQFLIADAVTSATVQYVSRATTAVTAGTPACTVSAPTITPTYT